MILGDVLATIAVIFLSAVAAWAGGVLSALLFPERTERASHDFEARPWATFFVGLGVALVLSLFGAVLFNVPNPLVRSLGAAVFLSIVGIALFGSGGLFRLVARRVRKHGGAESDYQAIAHGGKLVVAVELLPFFGWFLLAPFVLITSFGAGCRALFAPRAAKVLAAPPGAEAQ